MSAQKLTRIIKMRIILKNGSLTKFFANFVIYIVIIPVILVGGLMLNPKLLPGVETIWANLAVQCMFALLIVWKTFLEFNKDGKSGKHKIPYLNRFKVCELYWGYFLYSLIPVMICSVIKMSLVLFIYAKIGWPIINQTFFEFIFVLLFPLILFFLMLSAIVFMFLNNFLIKDCVVYLFIVCFTIIFIWLSSFIMSGNGKLYIYWGYIIFAIPVLNLYIMFGEYANLAYVYLPVIVINITWIVLITSLVLIKNNNSKKQKNIKLLSN